MHILAPYAGLAVKTFGLARERVRDHNDMGIDYERVKFCLPLSHVHSRFPTTTANQSREFRSLPSFTVFPERELLAKFYETSSTRMISYTLDPTAKQIASKTNVR